MAGASLLTLLDDIATLLDDVALMTKVAAKKTAGVLGDDLAVNAEQVSGFRASREIPVVWAVAKGSFKNKCLLVPAALVISLIAPWLITPILMLGGAYLCYEGVEKIIHSLQQQRHTPEQASAATQRLNDENLDLVAYEQTKIKGAIRTDLVLSAEIIVIALGTVKDASLLIQSAVVTSVAIGITIGVYGLVAGIVKIDDAGFYLIKRHKLLSHFGRFLVWFSPVLMKSLTFIGTIAMFLVGGGIILHGLPILTNSLAPISHSLSYYLGESMVHVFFNLLIGMLLGGLIVAAETLLTHYKKTS